MAGKRDARNRGWYTISVDTLRGLGWLVLVVVLAGGSWLGWRAWSEHTLRNEAAFLIDEVGALLERATRERPSGAFAEEFESARGGYEAARRAAEQNDFRTAVAEGRRSRALLLAVLDAAGTGSASGEAQFIAIQGSVEMRRGDQGEWEPARARRAALGRLRQDRHQRLG